MIFVIDFASSSVDFAHALRVLGYAQRTTTLGRPSFSDRITSLLYLEIASLKLLHISTLRDAETFHILATIDPVKASWAPLLSLLLAGDSLRLQCQCLTSDPI